MMPSQPDVEGPRYSYAHDRLVVPTQGALRPLGSVLRALPAQYRHVLQRPSVTAFADELPQAEWRSVWFQLLGWGLISAIVGFISWLIARTPGVLTVGSGPTATQVVTPPAPYGGQLLSIPLEFFVGMGLLYLAARLFGGRGTFLAQSYVSVLVHAPLGALISVLAAIPYVSILAVVVAIYELILQICAVRAVHHVSTGRAVGMVLVPALALLVLGILVVVVFSAGLVGSLLS
jgi:hypothetical protein